MYKRRVEPVIVVLGGSHRFPCTAVCLRELELIQAQKSDAGGTQLSFSLRSIKLKILLIWNPHANTRRLCKRTKTLVWRVNHVGIVFGPVNFQYILMMVIRNDKQRKNQCKDLCVPVVNDALPWLRTSDIRDLSVNGCFDVK